MVHSSLNTMSFQQYDRMRALPEPGARNQLIRRLSTRGGLCQGVQHLPSLHCLLLIFGICPADRLTTGKTRLLDARTPMNDTFSFALIGSIPVPLIASAFLSPASPSRGGVLREIRRPFFQSSSNKQFNLLYNLCVFQDIFANFQSLY